MHYVASMTTSTSLPQFAQPRTDLLRITTTAHANMAIWDSNARGPLDVVWQGQTQRVIEAPRVSLAPSTGVPPAIFLREPAAHRGTVETSKPYYPPCRHEDEALHTSSEERYFTPTRGSSRYEPFSPMGGRRRITRSRRVARRPDGHARNA